MSFWFGVDQGCDGQQHASHFPMTSDCDDRPGGKLSDNITYFARTLRRAGLPVGPAHVLQAVEAVAVAGVQNREDFYWALQTVFVSKRDQRLIFDEAFQVFWQPRGLMDKMLEILSPTAPPPNKPLEKPKAGAQRVADAMAPQAKTQQQSAPPEIEIDAKLSVSGREILQSKDFGQMTAAEIAEARKAIAALRLPLNRVKTRRLVPTTKAGLIDGRRTLRASLRSGGALIDLKRRAPAEITPPVVAMIDISGSMSQYSRLFLHFMHGLMATRRRVHTFLFGTRLTNVTRQLAMKDPDEALEACTGAVEDWSGGTRIGTALSKFNRDWSRRVLSGGPIVLLMTDGLERDEGEELGPEIERLHKSCRRLIWLNPLLRYDGFQPRAAGVRSMLPHVDEFRSVHSLDAVADLCEALSGRSAPGPVGGSVNSDPKHWMRLAP